MCGRVKLEGDFSQLKIAFGIPDNYPAPNCAPKLERRAYRQPADCPLQRQGGAPHARPDAEVSAFPVGGRKRGPSGVIYGPRPPRPINLSAGTVRSFQFQYRLS